MVRRQGGTQNSDGSERRGGSSEGNANYSRDRCSLILRVIESSVSTCSIAWVGRCLVPRRTILIQAAAATTAGADALTGAREVAKGTQYTDSSIPPRTHQT
jgi:hypothetical protein